ncbi:MAG: NAD(P)-binding domain-containing protein [Mycoplasmataceae bacterium]|nr:NAD(P)-binding domain-containing protein [Mycoplasmataceae bacterium]
MKDQKKIKTINPKKIVVVGTGAFGTAIAESLIRDEEKNNEIVLFGINIREINDINKNHKNSKYYSLKLSSKLFASNDPVKTFKNVDIILLAVPSSMIKTSLIESIIPNLTKSSYFINLSKGFDYLNIELLSNVIKKYVPIELNNGVLKLAGASFASELIHKQPTSFVLAADKIKISRKVYKYLNNKTMKIIPSNSLDAVEWISIIKNTLALLQGIIAGLKYKVNTRSLFFTQSVVEMKNLLKSQGLSDSAIFSPAGIGDMFLTGSSMKSRNYSTGYEIGKANKVTKKTLQKFTTIEGIRSIEILLKLSKRENINLKLIEILYDIFYKKEKPSKVIENYLEKF